MKLTAARVKTEARAGRYNDGRGLYLLVRSDGRKSWVLRYRLASSQRDMGLGPYPDVSLAAARQLALDAREKLRAGQDPIEARRSDRKAQAKAVEEEADRTFKVVAERYVARQEAGWKNAKHRYQWRATLATYAYPKLGDLDVAEIDRAAVLSVLEPIWSQKPETASRLRGRIETVLDFAAAKGMCTSVNPARWRDLRHDLPARSKIRPVENQPALPWQQMPAFMVELRRRSASAARALEFTILTAGRTSEILLATWREIDLASATWTVPAKRMKAGKLHRVPLSEAAMAVLRHMEPLASGGDSFVFPGPRHGRALSQMSVLMLLRRMQSGLKDDAEKGIKDDKPRWVDVEGRPIVVHGFRATFRTWAGDRTTYPREVVEAALAHVVKDKTEAAYARGDLLERRRPLMQAWADQCDGKAGGDLVDLEARRRSR